MNANKDRITERWQEEAALQRFRMIAPLVDETLDHAKRVELRKRIAIENELSYKTIKRYDDSYRTKGFEGLKPRDHSPRNQGKLPDNFSELLQEAIQLRREIPTRSVEQIIKILEIEGWAAPGVLKASTLQRYLYNAGLGKKQICKYTEARETSSRRFCRPHRMELIQGDIKYGPQIRDKDGKLPGIKGALLSDAVGTVAGSMMGTSTITTFVESSSGIMEGGRTGLTAIFGGLFFVIALFFSPIFLTIPSFATAPALIIVGFMMMQSVNKIAWSEPTEAMPAFFAIACMPLMYSISEGICMGIISYVLINFAAGKREKITIGMYILAALFILKYFLI